MPKLSLPALPAELIRFASVSAFWAVADFAIGLFLIEGIGLAPAAALLIAIAVCGVGGYVSHEFFTYRRSESALSPKRLALFLVTMTVAYVVRVGVFSAVEMLLPRGGAMTAAIALGCAIAASFIVNFALARTFVFRAIKR